MLSEGEQAHGGGRHRGGGGGFDLRVVNEYNGTHALATRTESIQCDVGDVRHLIGGAKRTLVKRTRSEATLDLERRRANKPARGDDLVADAAANARTCVA